MNDKVFDMAESVMVQYVGSEGWAFTSDELKKFAELIIRKCCAIADEAERADVPVLSSKFVKAYFGIE